MSGFAWTLYDLVISDEFKLKTIPGIDNGNNKRLAMSDNLMPLPERLNRETHISAK